MCNICLYRVANTGAVRGQGNSISRAEPTVLQKFNDRQVVSVLPHARFIVESGFHGDRLRIYLETSALHILFV